MQSTISVEQLRQIRLFETLDESELRALARHFHHARYRVTEMLFEQGDVGKAFYILVTGILRVRRIDARGNEHVIDYYRAPHAFGETSLLTGAPHDATVDVFSEFAELFVLTRDEWLTFLAQYPAVQGKLNVRPDVRTKLAMPRFPWLGEGEYVIVYTRRHWFALLLMLRFPLLVAVGLILIAGLVSLFSILSNTTALVWLDTLLWGIAIVWLVGAVIWTVVDWSNDYLIITNRRVVHYERVWGLREERTEAPIEQVSNVNESSLGLAARLLNFADVRIETAGHQVDIFFPYVPRRLQVRQNIFSELEHVRERAERAKREQLRQQIRDRLIEYIAPPKVVAAPTTMMTTNVPAPVPMRQRRQSGLGKRLNSWFGMQIEEKGKITWRKHWLDLLRRTGKWLGITLAIAFAGPLLFFATGVSFDLPRLAFIALWVFALAGFGFATWWHYEDWRNDIYQLTDENVLDIERAPFRLKERSVATTLDRIQNVSYNKPTFWNNFFNYGDVIIETAGGEGRLVFKNVSNPAWATQEIFRRREAQRDRRQKEQVQRRVDDFLDWVLVYHQILQQQGDVHAFPAQPSPPTPTSSETSATSSA
ncbi:MAG: cyclic nucleotide-binding domain-containing protein [Anaerolineae bacterium]|nr:cyclic nucleotide-binding domain-containing protein [Anaerolineae bacterium]